MTRYVIAALAGTVVADGREVPLRNRELELICALARRREATSREALCDLLWPDRDVESAKLILKVMVHALRRRLGSYGAVVSGHDGLRLPDHAEVDLWEAEDAARGPVDADRLLFICRRLAIPRSPRTVRWEWFDAVEGRARYLLSVIAQRVARHALDGGRPHAALAIADEVARIEPTDETAHELAIAAHLALGDHAAALRRYRYYRDTLRAELDCEPSPALRAMLAVEA